MLRTDNFKKIEVSSIEELKDWLHKNHSQKESVWLLTYKKIVPEKYLSTSDVLNELLCYGWIDGIRRKLDEERTMQLISPRRIDHWAKTYKVRAEKLIKEGKMQDAGFKSIEISRQNGMWDFMDDVDKLIIPKDLQEALAKYRDATDFFYAINDSSKRFVLRWIKVAKTDKTRASRVEQIAQLSSKGVKLKGS
jgi:uncharacterized protein YdeI (YjbR/CyaY-like superfamily)